MAQIDMIQQQVKVLRTRLNQGELFETLPEEIAAIMDSSQVSDPTPVDYPTDDAQAIQQIMQIKQRIGQTADPSITDTEAEFLIAHLASPNPAVRDKGVFFLINDLLQHEAFSNAQMKMFFLRLQAPDVLFAHINEAENDGVFLRSFAVMILSGLVYADQNRYHVFSVTDYRLLVQNIGSYLMLERDGRGYVPEKGWAHTYTHVGNVLDELSHVGALPRSEKIFLLAAAIEGWRRIGDSLVFGEDQRIALYLSTMANMNKIYREFLIICLKYWQSGLVKLRPEESYRFWVRWYNRNRLLQAMMMRADLPQSVADYLQQIADLF